MKEDSKKREFEVLNLVVQHYIKESKPISSGYLCDRANLSCSSATVRNVMESLEKKGYLSHIHTSSGRVPTQEGFQYYVGRLKEENMLDEEIVGLLQERIIADMEIDLRHARDIEYIFDRTLDVLATISGYASLVAISGFEDKFFFRGMRFIFNQPEFEDIHRLKSLFYALEVKIDDLQDLLFRYTKEDMCILIGDQIGVSDISGCSMVISGIEHSDLTASLALLGPMRMDYVRAVSALHSVKHNLESILEGVWDETT
ncbi:MAG: hypothetical protein JXD21_08815 [Candidatus Omnitrophica bacterium]|nr:hypothetical protein [Candidatus Omnitrophota bacterium]